MDAIGTRIVFFFLVIVSLLLSACGGGDGGQTVSSDTDPCTVVTAQEAGQILGTTVTAEKTEGQSYAGATSTGCQYKSTDMKAFATVSLAIYPDSSSAQTGFKGVKGSSESVSGVGDDAFSQGSILAVLKDNVVVLTGATTLQGGQNLDLEKQLAQMALPRL